MRPLRYGLFLALLAIPAACAEPSAALANVRAQIVKKDYVQATSIAAEALKQTPDDPELLGLFGVACMQTFQCLPYAFDVWQKAIANGASIRIPGYRLQDIRAGFNPWKAVSMRARYERTEGVLVITSKDVSFDAVDEKQSFRLPIAELGVSEVPGVMAVKDPTLQGYDGAEHDEGSIFLTGKVRGKKVEIPVNLLGSRRVVVSGQDFRRNRYRQPTIWESIQWRNDGTGRLAYVTMQSIRKLGWTAENQLEGTVHEARPVERPQYRSAR